MVKRAYIYISRRNYGKVEKELHLAYKVGKLVGVWHDQKSGNWQVIHLPSGLLLSVVDTFFYAKSLAHMFDIVVVSEKTTQEEIEADQPTWNRMRNVYSQWHQGVNVAPVE